MMEFKEIKDSLLQAVKLIESFEKEAFIIDKESALDKIRHAYELLRFGDAEQSCSKKSAMETAVAAALIATDNEESAEPEVEVEFIIPDEDETEEDEETEEVEESNEDIESQSVEETDTVSDAELTPNVEAEPAPQSVVETAPEPEAEKEPTPEPEVEQKEEQEPEQEQTPEPEPEQKVEQPKNTVFEQSLFGNDEQWSRPVQSRRKIMALYGEVAPQEEVKNETAKVEVAQSVVAPEEKIEEKREQVLGEAIESQPTIGDTILKQRSVAETAPVETLRKAISIADRFMLIRDLFGGDVDMYEEAIDTLDTTDNFDDCIIYITENFSWRPSSEGAKLIVDLLQRKFK